MLPAVLVSKVASLETKKRLTPEFFSPLLQLLLAQRCVVGVGSFDALADGLLSVDCLNRGVLEISDLEGICKRIRHLVLPLLVR